MLEKFQAIENKYLELENLISDPVILADQSKWLQHTQAHAKLAPIVAKIREYKEVYAALADTNEMLRDKQLDDELKSLVQEELISLKLQDETLAEELRVLMLPKDPNDDKNVIVEIRGGAGGDEAALFAGELFRMYTRYAETQGWRMEILDSSPTELGGFKEAVFVLEGVGVYSRLKFESGVHRVQRIPSTESGGRIHTSTVTVAVLPEAEDVDITINPGDIRIDTYRASGAGGQHINKTDSAIRITHAPTGIVVTCQDQKSQLKNKEQAMRVLRARVLEKAKSEQHAEVAEARKSQVGTGDRSERIRTYNFPQGRVTDHRIGLTLHKLDFILNGDLSELINALTAADQSERLQQVE